MSCKNYKKSVFEQNYFEYDYLYDWVIMPDKKVKEDEPMPEIAEEGKKDINMDIGTVIKGLYKP